MRKANMLLYGVFERLRAEGMQLSVRDYLDALAALEAFPEPFKALRGVIAATGHEDGVYGAPLGSTDRIRDRDQIVWMCQVLWAREPKEEHLVQRVITEELGLADTALSLRLYAKRAADDLSGLPAFTESPVPEPTRRDPAEPAAGPPAGDATPAETETGRAPAAQTEAEWTAEIGAELDEQGQAVLPGVSDLPIPAGHRFSMKPQPLMSELWLTALWRRLFKPRKTDDLARIDVQETVREASRTGYIAEPRYAIRHINTARLTVFIDVSGYMKPWAPFRRMMCRTLIDGSSRLEQVSIAYFANAPGRRVYGSDRLRGATVLSSFLREARGNPVLVFGEAGTLEPRRRDLDQRMTHFFETVLASGLRPVVWINPMQKRRWHPSFQTLPEKYPHVHCLPFNAETLLRAVDLMRGTVT